MEMMRNGHDPLVLELERIHKYIVEVTNDWYRLSGSSVTDLLRKIAEDIACLCGNEQPEALKYQIEHLRKIGKEFSRLHGGFLYAPHSFHLSHLEEARVDFEGTMEMIKRKTEGAE